MGLKTDNKAKIGLFSLVMIAIVSVDSLRNIPVSAQYGFSLITFYLIAGIMFFLPLAWVTAKLAARYPNTGGSYVWVTKAFGSSSGYVAILLQWIYNIIWYPTIFAFITATAASLFFPDLQNNKWFLLSISVGLFWMLSLLHCRGIRTSSWISIVSAIVGTLLPMIIMIGLAIYWLISGKSSVTPMSWGALVPTMHDIKNIGFFSNVLFSLLGLEVIAMHAGNVINPGRAYPRAVSISAITILLTIVCSSLALCVIMPVEKLSLITGLSDVLQIFFAAYSIHNVASIIGICIIIGGLGISSSWMIGLARGFQVAMCAMDSPAVLQNLNKHGAPSGVLFLQSIVYSILMSVFLLFPDIDSSYWLLSAITAQFALLYYVLVFVAAFKLLRQEKQSRVNNVLSVLLPGLACSICLAGVVSGFIPPDFVDAGSQLKYQFIFISVFAVLGALMIYKLKYNSK
ncbi:MAG: APC family permease [Legionellaceae bacterium]|nr:APC family permease [Legionellaceae bacterium]